MKRISMTSLSTVFVTNIEGLLQYVHKTDIRKLYHMGGLLFEGDKITAGAD